MKHLILLAVLAFAGCASVPAPVIWHKTSSPEQVCEMIMREPLSTHGACSRWQDGEFHIWSEEPTGEMWEHEMEHYRKGAFHKEKFTDFGLSKIAGTYRF